MLENFRLFPDLKWLFIEGFHQMLEILVFFVHDWVVCLWKKFKLMEMLSG